ncbi:MAG TPA: hypothetical protein VHR18_14975 [Solirubrobacterales bacterium]|jgi:hypothetical protein|nr:hypothetical protein [Solirubrobacterales bacterium]
MAGLDQPGGILARAVAYPYEAPLRSFVQLGTRTLDLPVGSLDLVGRTAMLAYGANAAPAVLARKLADLPAVPLPVVRAELDHFDVVYSAHISPYGAVPSTLQRSPGTTVPVFVAYPTSDQQALLTTTEPNYELRRLADLSLRTEAGEAPTAVNAYVSRHGCLALDDAEVALAAVAAAGRRLASMGEVEVLEHVRHLLAPELDLERFVESSLDPGMAHARSAVLHGNAIPLAA